MSVLDKKEALRRQSILRMAGYNVKEDGRWGPWQQKLWEKLHTKEKLYSPTVWGLLQRGYDSLTGNTTYRTPDLEELVDLKGTPSTGKTLDEKAKDYWHPIKGAGERWKTSMKNNTNPIKGVYNTVVPAVTGAVAVNVLPEVATRIVTRGIPKVVETVARHPLLAKSIAKKGATNFAKSLAKGMIGGTAVDLGLEMTTDKDWSHWASDYLGISPELASWLNPGYLLGGKDWGITKRYKAYRNAAKTYKQNAQEALNFRENVFNPVSELFWKADTELQNARGESAQAYLDFTDAVSEAAHLGKAHPIRTHTLERATRRILGEHVRSDDLPVEELDIRVSAAPEIEVSRTTSSRVPTVQKLSFEGPKGKPVETKVTMVPSSSSSVTKASMDYVALKDLDNPNYVLSSRIENTGRPLGTILEGDTRALLEGIGSYVDELNALIGEDGVVAGSLIPYRTGVIKGTVTDTGELIGPADTEIYTTYDRLNSLKSKLGFSTTSVNSVGGEKGISPYTFRNNHGNHRGVDTELNIIESDHSGMAKGKVAHQIYRALFPKEYHEFVWQRTLSGDPAMIETLSLPITAEDLLQTLRRNPDAMETHLLTDMMGIETFTKGNGGFMANALKANKRLFSFLFNPDDNAPQKFHNILKILGTYNMGEKFKLGSELYKVDFSDVADNKAFLMRAYSLTEDEADRIASNPDLVRNAFDYFNYSATTGTRLVGNDVLDDYITQAGKKVRWHNPLIELFYGNGAFNGGLGNGPGMNIALLRPLAGWYLGKTRIGSRGDVDMNVVAVTQRPLTLYPEKIKKPTDLLKRIDELENTDYSQFYEGELAKNLYAPERTKPIEYNMQRMKELRDLAYKLDIPVVMPRGLREAGEYIYAGGLTDPIAMGVRRSTLGYSHELGSLLPEIWRTLGGSGLSVRRIWSSLPPIKDLPPETLLLLKDFQKRGYQLVRDKLDWKNKSFSERGKILSKLGAVVSDNGTNTELNFNAPIILAKPDASLKFLGDDFRRYVESLPEEVRNKLPEKDIVDLNFAYFSDILQKLRETAKTMRKGQENIKNLKVTLKECTHYKKQCEEAYSENPTELLKKLVEFYENEINRTLESIEFWKKYLEEAATKNKKLSRLESLYNRWYNQHKVAESKAAQKVSTKRKANKRAERLYLKKSAAYQEAQSLYEKASKTSGDLANAEWNAEWIKNRKLDDLKRHLASIGAGTIGLGFPLLVSSLSARDLKRTYEGALREYLGESDPDYGGYLEYQMLLEQRRNRSDKPKKSYRQRRLEIDKEVTEARKRYEQNKRRRKHTRVKK